MCKDVGKVRDIKTPYPRNGLNIERNYDLIHIYLTPTKSWGQLLINYLTRTHFKQCKYQFAYRSFKASHEWFS